MSATPATQLTQDEVNEFHALSRLARRLLTMQADLVEEVSRITGEEPDADGLLDGSVAWDVVHNGEELPLVLRRCNLAIPDEQFVASLLDLLQSALREGGSNTKVHVGDLLAVVEAHQRGEVNFPAVSA